MQVTVTIPDEIAARAQARGVSPESYVEGLLLAQTTPPAGIDARRSETVNAMLRFAEQHQAFLGEADLKSLLHEGHRY